MHVDICGLFSESDADISMDPGIVQTSLYGNLEPVSFRGRDYSKYPCRFGVYLHITIIIL